VAIGHDGFRDPDAVQLCESMAAGLLERRIFVED
jgi:hypothetical protein